MPDTSGPRLLLRRLHKVLAGKGAAQKRLDTVVMEIAQNMLVDVCSVYLVRADRTLELFATHGLKSEAVHITRMAMGEGLVGYVAERSLPLNLAEARDHPKYVYYPETGEELYHAMAGVPIVRGGLVAGVLVVQTKKARVFNTEEMEALQTVAMVVAEISSSAELLDPSEAQHPGRDINQQEVLVGKLMAEGVAAGEVVFHEPRIEITQHVSTNIKVERTRLEEGLENVHSEVSNILNMGELAVAGEHREILEAYQMFAKDRGWRAKMLHAIDQGLTAEASVERIQQDIRHRMSETPDLYLRERLSDLDDLSSRLIRLLMGMGADEIHKTLNKPSLVVARSMGPAELLDYNQKYLKGIILEEGSINSHMVIVARALGIPVLGQVHGALDEMDEGEAIVLDADEGKLFLNPTDDIVKAYRESIEGRERQAAIYEAERDLPTVSKDGQKISLLMNAGLMIDVGNLEKTGADGIGLFRTEFQFMVSSTLPKLDSQVDLYKRVLDQAGEKPVVFRTLDIGGDKRVPFLHHDREENPAMGWRAIRLTMERPVLMRLQIRALIKAGAGKTLNILVPMVAHVSEFEAIRSIVDEEIAYIKNMKLPMPKAVKVGSMLEIPSLVWQIDPLLEKVDFLSIGTNDLMQFFFAVDRSNPKLVDRYDLISSGVLSFLKFVIEKADIAGVPVTSCGEMGSRPLEALALMAIGVRGLSISPASIGTIKAMVRSVDIKALQKWIIPYLDSPEPSFRENLKVYSNENNIII
jgi:phosphotransferase system enzyme I (PtsP)